MGVGRPGAKKVEPRQAKSSDVTSMRLWQCAGVRKTWRLCVKAKQAKGEGEREGGRRGKQSEVGWITTPGQSKRRGEADSTYVRVLCLCLDAGRGSGRGSETASGLKRQTRHTAFNVCNVREGVAALLCSQGGKVAEAGAGLPGSLAGLAFRCCLCQDEMNVALQKQRGRKDKTTLEDALLISPPSLHPTGL